MLDIGDRVMTPDGSGTVSDFVMSPGYVNLGRREPPRLRAVRVALEQGAYARDYQPEQLEPLEEFA